MNDEILLPLTAAGAIAISAFALFQWIAATLQGDKRKLAQRLSMENRVDAVDVSNAVRTLRVQTDSASIIQRIPPLAYISKMLFQAWPSVSLAKFCGVSVGLAVVAFVIAWAIMGTVLIGAAAAVVAGYIPYMILSGKRSARERQLSDQLPEALDFLSRVLRSGHSFSTGLQMLADELPMPLSAEFRRCYDQHSLGQSVEDALRDTAARIGSTEFSFFVTTVCIQRQTGGDMSEVLGNISDMIRSRIRLQSHVMAKTAEGRFTGYILVAFPIIMFFLSYSMNPGYAGMLLHGWGLVLLATAGGLCLLGLFAIQKLTQIKV
jgi:tight adherence protein B